MNRILTTIAAFLFVFHMTVGCCSHACGAAFVQLEVSCHHCETCPLSFGGDRHQCTECDCNIATAAIVSELDQRVEPTSVPTVYIALISSYAPSCNEPVSPPGERGHLRRHLALGVLLI